MSDLLVQLKDAYSNKRPYPFRRIDGDMAVAPVYAVSAYELAELMKEISKRDVRIVEHEAAINEYKENELLLSKDGVHFRKAMDVLKEQSARIAELKAALKPFSDCEVSPAYGDDETFKCLLMVGDLRAARAAYLGEKG
jgi:hypothetical protein